MQWGAKEEYLQSLAATGVPVAALDNKPDISALDWLWLAYNELSTCRPSSMGGPMPVPWSDINQWAIRYNLDDGEFELLVRVVRFLDKILTDWHKANQDKK